MFACRLTEKAFLQGLRVLINMSSREAAEHIDSLLWTFRPDSFVPHDIISEPEPENLRPTPVAIRCPGIQPDFTADVCINLATEAPGPEIKSLRQIEIALNDPVMLTTLRQRYKTLTSQNIAVEVHDFTKKQR